MRTFQLTQPLPTGTTVLEASAGTGKTFAIESLAVRFLAEGRAPVDALLLVTFSRSATAELRSRVRARIQSSVEALASACSGTEPTDLVDRLLADCPADECRRRADRLAFAASHFDKLTIMTTHEFCHGMIAGLGILASQEPQSTLAEDQHPLADEVSSDVYLRRYAHAEQPPPFGWLDERGGEPGARTIGRDAIDVVGDLLCLDSDGIAAERAAFASEVRGEVDRRKRERRLFSFDDQLGRLAATLSDPTTGDLACERLAARYPVVLVDEFQDTDPVQWRILRSAFGRDSTLVLIGDPKQAIYAFRGADVHAYTSAVRSASDCATLATNYRSDGPVVDAVGALFRGLLLGEAIQVPRVTAHRLDSRLVATPKTPWERGLQVRVVDADEPISPWTASDRIGADVVAVVSALLSGEAPLRHPDRPLTASDIAILVRSNRRGHELATALAAVGVPATFSGTSSVFASKAAADWLALLAALDQTRRPFVQRAVLTDFLGGTVPSLATASEGDLADWSLTLHGWARTLRSYGIPALMSAFDRDTNFTPRLLGRMHGERDVTDHRHIAALLHERATGSDSGARELHSWLRSCVSEAASSERTRRLETDADAVQIMTVHRAKGRQFPVVLLPEAGSHWKTPSDTGRRLVLPAFDGREVDLGGRFGHGRSNRWRRFQDDESDETLRTLYVGLTRAQSHAVVWWANHWDVAASPLHRLLRADHDCDPPRRPNPAYSPTSPLKLDWLDHAGIAAIAVPESTELAEYHAPAPDTKLSVRAWPRTIDYTWRRTSYSGLTASAHDLAHEPGFKDDEPDVGGDSTATDLPAGMEIPSPMALLPGGPSFGTLVHTLYERLDAREGDWRERLEAEAEAALRAWPIPGLTARTLADSLAPSLSTPLGPLGEGTTLADFGPGNRLTELEFEFALSAPRATLADIAALLRPHVAGTALASYPEKLEAPELASESLHGFLTGSIDAVLRLPSGAYLVVDYKTNRLGPSGAPLEDLLLGHYTSDAMAEAMMASHYPLQALLYEVALHRFLAGRLTGYVPERQLAGAVYLFVRGMAGPDTPNVDGEPLGVFSWRPPVELVDAVSALLAGSES